MALSLFSSLIGPVTELIDSMHTSEEEKLAAKTKFISLQEKFLEYEQTVTKEAAKTVRKEVEGTGLKAMWRPITMLTFTALVVAHWLGFTAQNLSEAQALELLAIVKFGLGGFVLSRSAEKIIPNVVDALKK